MNTIKNNRRTIPSLLVNALVTLISNNLSDKRIVKISKVNNK